MQKNFIDDFISYDETDNYTNRDVIHSLDSEFFCKQEYNDEPDTENHNPANIQDEFANLSLKIKEEYIPNTKTQEEKNYNEETKVNSNEVNVFGNYRWHPERNEFSPPAHSTDEILHQEPQNHASFIVPPAFQNSIDLPKRRAESKMRFNQNPKRVHVKSPKQAKDLGSYDPDLSIGDAPTQSEFSEELTERRKTASRLSASKRYPQQVIVGFGRHIVRQHEKLNEPFDRHVVNFVKENILGKSDQTYKISTIKDIRRIFQRVPVKDTPLTINVKEFLFRKFREFFRDGSYFIWLKKDYRGEILNKVWLAINKKSIEERFFEDKAPGFNSVARDVPDLEQKFYQMLDHKLETIEAKA